MAVSRGRALTVCRVSDDTSAPEIDREALRARYREERDKRIRPDGNEQYLNNLLLEAGLAVILYE